MLIRREYKATTQLDRNHQLGRFHNHLTPPARILLGGHKRDSRDRVLERQ